ncbi:MAG: hypothetical protein IK068_04220, partial [Lachnospiraceae bacterium]|nr:hypothetical protein [Lachnospiraceae bacterium]
DLFYGRETSFENFFHKAYSYIAALFLSIFGDTLTVPVFINIILYVASAVLLFFSVMFIFGKIPAIFVFGALMLSKAPITYMLDISGFNMFFLAISLLIFLVTYFLDVFTKVKPVMCYIVSFVTLIVVIVINHFTYKPFEPVFAFDLSILNFRPSGYIFVSIAITFLALYGLLSFIKAKEDEISFANILLVVLLLILMFDYSSNNTYLFTIISFCIFAGIGLDNLVFRNYKAVPIADAAEQETVLEPAFEPVNEVLETSEAAEEIHEEVSDEPVKDNAAIEAETETPQKTEETPKKREVPSFFETPLPMPKKHVKKSFDYAFEPSGDMLKYDIEISPDDDFDIK